MSCLLYITNIAGKRMSYNYVGSAIEAAKAHGIDFYSAANRSASTKEEISEDEQKYGVHLLHIDLARSPFSFTNVKAYKQLCKIIKEENIDVIHCNTPVGGVLGRLAGKKCKVKKVIYQAHGFHFYKGAPKKNWLLYYPIEKWLARYTDALVTINREDFEFAKNKLKLRNSGNVYYVPGVGIDASKYTEKTVLRENKLDELNIPRDAFVLISVGELNQNKNNRVIISAMEKLRNPHLHYILCGVGEKQKELQEQADEAGLHNNVHFLGYRTDVKELYQAADCFVMPSFREGLSRSIMEAMASGLPCVVSKIRGNVDLIEHGKGGYTCVANDSIAFAEAIEKIFSDDDLRNSMIAFNLERINCFDFQVVKGELEKIYREVLN